MKKLIALIASLSLALAPLAPLAFVAGTAVTLSACKTSQQTVAFKSITGLQSAVELSLDTWLRYVYHERVRIGKITDRNELNGQLNALLARERKVMDALAVYKASMAVTQIAINEARLKKTDPPPMDLATTGQAFINASSTK